MQVPKALLENIKHTAGFDEAAFVQTHADEQQITSVRFNPARNFVPQFSASLQAVPWSRYGHYLAERPSFTFDPFFHAGCYYVQEASSMFLEQALIQTTDITQSLRMVDLCAAPGGKSTHLQSLLSPGSLLLSNEVIRARAAVLRDNIVKWGTSNVVVSNNDPKEIGRLSGFFDVMVADAPCSGSGLFRRDPEAVQEWSMANVALCAQRQQRILADALPALKEGGVLIYSTCSYSPEEDEAILQWLTTEMGLEGLRLQVQPAWGITEVQTGEAWGYRFWPHRLKGEGFFISCLRKRRSTGTVNSRIKNKPEVAGKKEEAVVGAWIDIKEFDLIKHQQLVYAWPQQLRADMQLLLQELHVLYAGIRVGELMRDKLVPDHALALSGRVQPAVLRGELDYETAIQYLQRKDIQVNGAQRGWNLLHYRGQALGWANVLPNRINNYYPKELRILKDK